MSEGCSFFISNLYNHFIFYPTSVKVYKNCCVTKTSELRDEFMRVFEIIGAALNIEAQRKLLVGMSTGFRKGNMQRGTVLLIEI